MSKVLSFLNANPIVIESLPGMVLFPDGQGNVAARVAATLEIEPENKAWEEHHIQLRFSLLEESGLECPVGSLEVVRVSIEHGDSEAVQVPFSADMAVFKGNLKDVCGGQFGCYQNSHTQGYGMLASIQEVIRAVEEGDLIFNGAA